MFFILIDIFILKSTCLHEIYESKKYEKVNQFSVNIKKKGYLWLYG